MVLRRLGVLTVWAMVCAGTVISQPSDPKGKAPQALRKALVTFVELGSVNCIPCRQMQPVMAAIEKKYGDQITIVFHDVWKPDQRHQAQKFGIRVIPTQVFLDRDGNEFFRHEGFFSEAEIDTLLVKRGLTAKSGG